MIWCYITVLLIHIILIGKYFVRGYVKSSMGPTVKVDLSEYQRLVQEWKQRSSRMQFNAICLQTTIHLSLTFVVDLTQNIYPF